MNAPNKVSFINTLFKADREEKVDGRQETIRLFMIHHKPHFLPSIFFFLFRT